MVSTENISSLANINKDTIVDGAKALLALKKNELVDKFLSAKTEIINQIKIDSEDLIQQKITSEVNYRQRQLKISTLRKTDNEKQKDLNQLEKDYLAEIQTIDENIKSKTLELENRIKAYLPQEIAEAKAFTKSTADSVESARNNIKNARKVKISTRSLITTIGVLANYLISTISIGNKKIENLVDKVNAQIKDIKTEQDIIKCKLLVNRAKLIITQNKQQLKTIRDILVIIEIILPLIDTILLLFKSNPIPSAVPPGIGVPLGTINTIDSKSKILDDIKTSASIILAIINQVISKLIDDLNYQESRLLPIEGLLENNIDAINSANLKSNNGLGYLSGYDYKGFKFFIKEENNPQFVVQGNKRRYAVAVNIIGREVMQSSFSFTLAPDVLVEELKLQIDRESLVS
jgi:hypothetical protein